MSGGKLDASALRAVADATAIAVNAKLSRAEDHLRVLEQIVEAGAVSNLLATRTDRDRHGRVRVRVKEMRDIPVEWHVTVGECVYNMRTALDHLAYGLNIIGARSDPPPNHGISQFPIYSDRSTYRHGGRRGRPARPLVAHFPRGARTAVERLQPYHGRKNEPVGLRRLSDLADLSNIDKHRRFPIAAVTPKRFPIPDRVGGHRVTAYTTQYRVLKPGATIVWLEVPTLPADAKEPHVDLDLTAQIELEGPAANPPVRLLFPHEPVGFTLRSILGVIDARVVPAFERWIPLLRALRHDG